MHSDTKSFVRSVIVSIYSQPGACPSLLLTDLGQMFGFGEVRFIHFSFLWIMLLASHLKTLQLKPFLALLTIFF